MMKKLIIICLCWLNICNGLSQRNSFTQKPTWSDEFNESYVDQSKWKINKRFGATGKVYYSGNDKDNIYIKNGVLNIVVRKEKKGKAQTSSAYISSVREFKTGKIEFRARCSTTAGLWPTIWLRGYKKHNISGEIDILEYISCMGKTNFQTNFHVWRSGVKNSEQHAKKIPIDITKWHVYTFEWYSNELVMLVDGKEYHSLKRSQVKDWPFNNDGYHLDITIGTGGWAESCGTEYNKLPQKMQVDWVRYYEVEEPTSNSY